MNQDLQRTAGSVYNVLSSYLALRQVQAESVAQQRRIDQDAQLLRGEFSRLMQATDERSAVLRQVFAEINTPATKRKLKTLFSNFPTAHSRSTNANSTVFSAVKAISPSERSRPAPLLLHTKQKACATTGVAQAFLYGSPKVNALRFAAHA